MVASKKDSIYVRASPVAAVRTEAIARQTTMQAADTSAVSHTARHRREPAALSAVMFLHEKHQYSETQMSLEAVQGVRPCVWDSRDDGCLAIRDEPSVARLSCMSRA